MSTAEPLVQRRAERRIWWRTFGLLTLAGVAWMLATPLMTGPDEVFQARRAAAVVRGELVGERSANSPILVDVTVPKSYLVAGEYGYCFTGQPVAGAPVGNMPAPKATCPEFGGGSKPVSAQTGQYRGQPFFYGLVGLPTLIDSGMTGAYLMRLIGVIATMALLASATVSVRRSQRSRLAWLALFGTVTPMTIYLSASTNPSAVEIAAALGVWASGILLARNDVELTGREVARFGVALVVLTGARGLGPIFAVLLVVLIAALAGRARIAQLARRADLWAWAAGAGAMAIASAAWLWTIQRDFPLDERPGSGLATAIDYLPFYLRQTIGVFGQNDSALPQLAAWVWGAALLGIFAVGLWHCTTRSALIAVLTLAGGVAISVTAEGFSLPPIGFFWQGRYAMPLLVGAYLLATCAPVRNDAAGGVGPRHDVGAQHDPHDRPVAPGDVGALLRQPETKRATVWLTLGVFLTVHAIGFLSVARHHGAKGGTPQSWWDLLVDPRWSPPLTFPVLLVVYVGALATLAWGIGHSDATPPPSDALGGGDNHTALRLTAHYEAGGPAS